MIIEFARHIAQGFAADLVVEIGAMAPSTADPARSNYRTLRIGLEQAADILRPIDQAGVAPDRTMIAIADIDPRSAQTAILLDRLRQLVQRGASAVIATSNPDADYFADLLCRYGLNLTEPGLVLNSGDGNPSRSPMALVDRFLPQQVTAAPPEFDVISVMTAFNEEDVLEHTISHLIAQGIRVHVIDNWSTDDSLRIAQSLAGTGMVTVEQFPHDGSSDSASWGTLLQRVSEVAAASRADWVIHHDADEIRYSPWRTMSLRDALYRVERAGFNAVDFTVIDFWPTSEHPVTDLEQDLGYFSFGLRPGHFVQVKGWANWMGRADLAPSGGHSAQFAGRKVFPYKFLLKHYPIRSQQHGERKVFMERQGRWDQAERQRGWHHHYDHYRQGVSFLRNRSDLERYDRREFDRKYLIERLTGINLPHMHRS